MNRWFKMFVPWLAPCNRQGKIITIWVYHPINQHCLPSIEFHCGSSTKRLERVCWKRNQTICRRWKRLCLSNQRAQKILDWRKEERCLASKHDFVDLFSLYFVGTWNKLKKHPMQSDPRLCTTNQNQNSSPKIYISFHSINWKWKQRRKGSKSICWLQVVQHPSEQS